MVGAYNKYIVERKGEKASWKRWQRNWLDGLGMDGRKMFVVEGRA